MGNIKYCIVWIDDNKNLIPSILTMQRKKILKNFLKNYFRTISAVIIN